MNHLPVKQNISTVSLVKSYSPVTASLGCNLYSSKVVYIQLQQIEPYRDLQNKEGRCKWV